MDEEQLFSRKDMREISERLDKIVYNNENGFSFIISFSIEQAIELINHWHNLPLIDVPDEDDEPITSEMFITLFFDSFIDYVKTTLEEDGIEYKDFDS